MRQRRQRNRPPDRPARRRSRCVDPDAGCDDRDASSSRDSARSAPRRARLRQCAEYRDQRVYMGCVVGRFANRIAAGRFSLDGTDLSAERQRERPQSPAWRLCGLFAQGVVDRVGRRERREPVAFVPGRGGRISGHADGRMPLQHRGRPVPAHRAHRRHRCAHDRESRNPQLLQSRRRGRHPAPPAGDTGGELPADRRRRHPDRRVPSGRRNAVRLPRPARGAPTRRAGAAIRQHLRACAVARTRAQGRTAGRLRNRAGDLVDRAGRPVLRCRHDARDRRPRWLPLWTLQRIVPRAAALSRLAQSKDFTDCALYPGQRYRQVTEYRFDLL